MKKLIFVAIFALALSCEFSFAKYDIPDPSDVVMYQVNPRNYAPENSFKVVKEHIGEIKDLGANVVWFMPICEIGVEKAVKSPYCVKNYTAVNPEFGTIKDFKAIVDECHKQGMIVIMDWVANHTSWDSQWIYDHPEWYTHNEKGEIIPPAGTGWNDVADLNFDNPELCQAMIDAMKFWVKEIGVDGFRCDAADYVPFEFWKDCVSQLRAIKGHKLLLLAEGQRKDHFEAGFDLNYAWQWLSALRRVYSGAQQQPQAGQERRRMGPTQVPVSSLFDVDKEEYAGIPEGKVKLRFTTNHDETAKMSPIREFYGNAGSLAAFVATTYIHGGMLIYGCQEVGYPGKINFFNYTEIDWNGNRDLFNEYKAIVSAFKGSEAIRKGDIVPYPDANVLAFERKTANEKVLVLINLRDEQRSFAVPADWAGKSCEDIVKGTKVNLPEKNIMLKPFEYIVVK